MANLNSSSSSRSRNLLWLSEQQEKLAAANRSRRSPSPNSNQRRPPVLAPKPQLTKPSPPQPPPISTPLAFSNPIYDEYRGPAEPISDLPSSSSSAQEPDQQKRTTVKSSSSSPPPPPPSFPVPKPRKSLANTSSVGVLSPKSPHLNLKPETSNSSTTSSSSNTSSSASSIENCIDEQQQQQLLLRQRRLDLTASDSVHSFLYFEQELPAKMTALINEIETLAESLASSVKEQPSLAVGTFRRKRIQVQKELFKFSFSSGSDMLPSPVSVLSPEEFSGRELADSDSKPTPTKHNTDSGVFSSGDNEISTVSEVSNVTSSESKVEKGGKQQKSATSIPPSPPPPQLPPRKNHPQYQKEPKAIENLAPPSLIAPSPVPSNYSTSTIPSKPPPPIPKLQRQEGES
ncbi:hypothetical protein TYRP_015208 [Tyrophagus putrescentiae]|nr:hypothetical protein TYRP_015208 [Tyrophagus putrescentiae]